MMFDLPDGRTVDAYRFWPNMVTWADDSHERFNREAGMCISVIAPDSWPGYLNPEDDHPEPEAYERIVIYPRMKCWGKGLPK